MALYSDGFKLWRQDIESLVTTELAEKMGEVQKQIEAAGLEAKVGEVNGLLVSVNCFVLTVGRALLVNCPRLFGTDWTSISCRFWSLRKIISPCTLLELEHKNCPIRMYNRTDSLLISTKTASL